MHDGEKIVAKLMLKLTSFEFSVINLLFKSDRHVLQNRVEHCNSFSHRL